LQFRSRPASVRHFSSSETHGYVLFPNVVHGRVVELQGRVYPMPRPPSHVPQAVCPDPPPVQCRGCRGRSRVMESLYFVTPRGRTQSQCVGALRHRRLAAGVVPAVSPGGLGLRRLDRDAPDRAIALARTFGARGRVLVPPEDLGPKGDLNDWLRVGAKCDPAVFRSMLERALATSPTPGRFRSSGYRLPVRLNGRGGGTAQLALSSLPPRRGSVDQVLRVPPGPGAAPVGRASARANDPWFFTDITEPISLRIAFTLNDINLIATADPGEFCAAQLEASVAFGVVG